MSKHTRQQKYGDKKATVMQNQKRRINPIALIIGATAIAGAVALALFVTNTTAPQLNTPAVANVGDRQVSYPVSLFEDGSARHFDYKADGMTLRYFIIKSKEGVIRAAFDACDVCWPAGKGYYQEGNHMVCRNCGRKFASELVNEVKGGCNPAPLNRHVQGDRIVLKVEDILKGKSYFNFEGKV